MRLNSEQLVPVNNTTGLQDQTVDEQRIERRQGGDEIIIGQKFGTFKVYFHLDD